MSHESGHAPKPYAHPFGIVVGLLILWLAAGGLVWVAFKVLHLGGEGG